MTKKGSEKSLAVPRQRTPAQGARPLGTPKRRSRSKKAKKRRSAAFFLTLFYFSPIDPSGAKSPHSVGADARHRPAPGRRIFAGRCKHRPPTRNHTVAVGASIARPQESCVAAKLPGRTLFAPTPSSPSIPQGGVLTPQKRLFIVTILRVNRRGGFHIRPCSLARPPHPPTKNEGHPHQVSLTVIQPKIYASARSFFTRLKITAPTTLPMASATRYSSA